MITENQIKRINELSKKSKNDGLTEAEKQEQLELRKQYIQSFRNNVLGTLQTIKFVDPKGNDVTPAKLRELKEQPKGPTH